MLNINHWLVILVMTLPISSLAKGSNQQGLYQLEELIKLAIRNSDQLMSAKFETQSAESDYELAKSNFLPQISAEATYSQALHSDSAQRLAADPKNKGMVIERQDPVLKKHIFNGSISASQLLYSFGKVQSYVDASKQAYLISGLAQKNTKLEVKLQTKIAYFKTVLAKKSVQIYTESHQNAKSNQDIFYRRFSSGRAPRPDLIKLERDVLMREPSLINAMKDFKNQLNELSRLTKSQIKAVKMPHKEDGKHLLSAYEQRVLKDKLVSSSPILKIQDLAIVASNHLLDAAKAERMPTIGAFTSVGYMGSQEESFKNDHNIRSNTVVGIKINIPIWNGGSKSSIISKRMAKKKSAEYRKKDTERKLSTKLENLIVEYNSLRKQQITVEKLVRVANSAFDMSRNRFKHGQTSVSEVNDSEENLTTAKLNYQQIKFYMAVTKSEIEYLTAL